ncbi:hypothetical protein [Spirosoma pomorum]
MSQTFDKLDTFSKRLLVGSIACSMILLSMACLIYSTEKVFAQPNKNGNGTRQSQTAVGLGCDEQFVYWFTTSGEFLKQEKKRAREIF